MIPAWTVLIPAALLVTSMVLAFETRLSGRVLWALVGLAGLVALLLLAGVIRF